MEGIYEGGSRCHGNIGGVEYGEIYTRIAGADSVQTGT